MAVEVRLATRADRDELVRLFHAIEVHYLGEAAPSRAVMARHVDEAVFAPGSCEIAIARAGWTRRRPGHVRRVLSRAGPPNSSS
jgi:hypothetical protein